MQGKSFFSLLDVDKYGGHMVKVRRFRDIICDNMSRTYIRLFTHIYVYTHTRTYMYVYTYLQGKLCCHYCNLHIIWGIWSFCDV